MLNHPPHALDLGQGRMDKVLMSEPRVHSHDQDKVQVEHTMTLEALIMGVIAREEAEKAPQPPTIEGTVTEEKP